MKRFDKPMHASAADGLRSHAADVMSDLAGIAEDTIASVAAELPVEAAVACGNCRLYGGVAPQVVFPAWLATTAARRLENLLLPAIDDADRLSQLWDDATSDEAEELVAGLLHVRMDSWAALLQLNDVLEHCSNDGDRAALAAATGDLEAAIDRFDRALFARQDYLATLTGSHLLDNFRGMLAPEFRDQLPWWLDGRLEAKAAEIDADTDRLLIETLFERVAVSETQELPTFADLCAEMGFIYAAAAATDTSLEPQFSRRAVIRWASPGSDAFAELVPPPSHDTASSLLVIDFVAASGAPLLHLVGTVCTLVGVTAVIEQRNVAGEPRAAAVFSALEILGAADRAAASGQVALAVGSPEVAWRATTA